MMTTWLKTAVAREEASDPVHLPVQVDLVAVVRGAEVRTIVPVTASAVVVVGAVAEVTGGSSSATCSVARERGAATCARRS
jgi:hypothetical protein